jgi:cytochrome c-type biogenesis protein CcmH/NrfG
LALFWLLVGVMSTLAALIVLLPWLRAIPHLHPLPSVPWPMVAGAALTVLAAVGLYIYFGRPDLTAAARIAASMRMPPMPTAAARGSANAPAGPALGSAGGSMESAIASLEVRLAKGGGTADDWELLAKSYQFLARPADAANARARKLPMVTASFAAIGTAAIGTTAIGTAATPASASPALSAQSLQRLGEAAAARRDRKYTVAAIIYRQLAASSQLNADGWADYADTVASMQGNKLGGEPETYIARALALDPQHPKALWLKASAAEEAGRWSDAAHVWQQLRVQLDPGSADARIVAANLQQDLKILINRLIQ